jgi:hypothetical protein
VNPAATLQDERGEFMNSYREVYDFAAGAGALEGYVYHKGNLEPGELSAWVGRLESQYRSLPAEVVKEFQDLCDQTVGRAIRSLSPSFGEDHPLLERLRGITRGDLPATSDDFQRHV